MMKKKNLLIGLIVLLIGFGVYQLIPKHNVFVKGPNMHYPHSAAVILQDGRVLVLGGKYAEAEIYDPKKNKFFLTGKMNFIREMGLTATLLKDGRVLVAGGEVQSKGIKDANGIYFPGGLDSVVTSFCDIINVEVKEEISHGKYATKTRCFG